MPSLGRTDDGEEAENPEMVRCCRGSLQSFGKHPSRLLRLSSRCTMQNDCKVRTTRAIVQAMRLCRRSPLPATIMRTFGRDEEKKGRTQKRCGLLAVGLWY
mmetsp:Transcript_24713/g.49354  ORF Transcript_24713/g.49354 Transcript_24713/m.49354 type:complete len:101 (-) Transcript_24713:11-313(-)